MMVVLGLSSLAFWFISLLFSGASAIALPIELLSGALDIMQFGAFVVGADLIGIVFANIIFWLGFKFTAGLLLFVWRLIPLT